LRKIPLVQRSFEIPQGSPINYTGKFPVYFIRNYALFSHIPHSINLPVRKSQCEESLILKIHQLLKKEIPGLFIPGEDN
jgi:hypothetical protein